ncbi:MAG: hypothetical protein HQ567_20375 [Candidatus Nealsonbacteria bacterium]|nr:hypothetical protein [Candidatus Nealsonbacteria bacterium]
MRRLVFAAAVLAAWACLAAESTHATPLSFSFVDPVGDHSGIVDLVGMEFSYDDTTRDYQILLTADDANPFYGDFRINVNLFNPDTGVASGFPALFQDVVNDFSLTAPTTSLTLTGSHPALAAWEIGDRVHCHIQ